MTPRAAIIETVCHLLILALAAVAFSLLTSCHATKPIPWEPTQQKEAVAPSAHETTTATEGVLPPIHKAQEAVKNTTPATFDADKPNILKWLGQAWDAATAAVAKATATEERAKAGDAAQDKLIAQVTDARKKADAAEKERAALAADKQKHENDWFGPATHRLVAALTFWTILGVVCIGGLVIGVGIVGSRFGLPELTQPVFKSIGGFIGGIRVVLYHAATFIWSLIPGVGHYADEHLNNVASLTAQVAASKAAADINGPANGKVAA